MSNGGVGGSQKSKMMATLIIGIVLGISGMGFVAWYVIVKNPASFNNKELHEPTRPMPQVQSAPLLPPPAAPASEAQNFEFYKVLPDKPEGGVLRKTPPAKPQVNPPATKAVSPAVPDTSAYLVQAGSFQNAGDAEKLKAKLALSGIEAAVQVVTIPGKGVWHRVRLGPYKGLAEANTAIAMLKQNGVNNATALHAQ